jgi:hypothetical protein
MCRQQHLCPLILDHHAALGDYSTAIVGRAKDRLQGLHIISTSELGAEILKTTKLVHDVPGSTVSRPKRVQNVRPEYRPSSFHVSVYHDNRVSTIRAFNTVVWKHPNGIRARGVGSGEGGESLVVVEKRRHLRVKNNRCAWISWKWQLILMFGCSRDGLNVEL